MESLYSYTHSEEVDQKIPASEDQEVVIDEFDQQQHQEEGALTLQREDEDDQNALDTKIELYEKLRVFKPGKPRANLPFVKTESSEISLGGEKHLRKASASKSIWRRFFHGFHRRISVVLPGFLKKENKKELAKARAQIALLEKEAEENVRTLT